MNAFKDFIKSKYELEELQEIAYHGCVSGCASGLIYYSETLAVYDQYAEDIHEVISDYLMDMGEDKLPESVMEHFGSLTQWKNALVWFGAEIVAQEVVNLNELA